MLRSVGLVAGSTAVIAANPVAAESIRPEQGEIAVGRHSVRFVDLTHRLTKAFSFGQMPPRVALEPIDGSGKAAGMRLNRLSLVEHTGTHIDAPSHFDAAGASLSEIPLHDLIVPLAVIDLRAKRAADGNAELEPDDIVRWERRNGPLPRGCCVAIWSGFDPLAPRAQIGGRPAFPGFSPALIETLVHRRAVKGVAVDSMSLDGGRGVPAYPFHNSWLKDGRWGIEGLTNLGLVPASGAVLVVGAPPVEGATGMPIRAIALF